MVNRRGNPNPQRGQVRRTRSAVAARIINDAARARAREVAVANQFHSIVPIVPRKLSIQPNVRQLREARALLNVARQRNAIPVDQAEEYLAYELEQRRTPRRFPFRRRITQVIPASERIVRAGRRYLAVPRAERVARRQRARARNAMNLRMGPNSTLGF